MLSSKDVCQRKLADTEESVYTRKGKGLLKKMDVFESFEKEAAYAKEEFLLRPSSESERHSFYHKEDVLVRRRKARCKTVVGGLERK